MQDCPIGTTPDSCPVHGTFYVPHPECSYTTPTDHVYAISEVGSDYVKIGMSRDPLKRLAELQTGNPRPLELMAVSEPITYALAMELTLRTILIDAGARPHVGEWIQITEPGLRVSCMEALTHLETWQAMELREITPRVNPEPVFERPIVEPA